MLLLKLLLKLNDPLVQVDIKCIIDLYFLSKTKTHEPKYNGLKNIYLNIFTQSMCFKLSVQATSFRKVGMSFEVKKIDKNQQQQQKKKTPLTVLLSFSKDASFLFFFFF